MLQEADRLHPGLPTGTIGDASLHGGSKGILNASVARKNTRLCSGVKEESLQAEAGRSSVVPASGKGLNQLGFSPEPY